MKNDSDKRDLIIVDEMSGITRWAPLAVVLSVVGGFVSLSWYAYHAGMQSVKEEDLVVVEADKSPMKEKPSDPGGMHFPNQDKTVFDTFASSGKQPPKVERVLPAPEEPLSKEVDSSDTSTFVNDKLHKGGTEQVLARDSKKQEPQAKIPPATDRQVITAQPEPEDDQSVTYVAPKQASAAPSQALDNAVKAAATDKRGQPFAPEKLSASDAQKLDAAKAKIEKAKAKPKIEFTDDANEEEPKEVAKEETPKENVKPKEEAKHEEKEPVAESIPAAGGGKSMIQLGAYRSEKEAIDAWGKMHLKQKELSDKKPLVVRADLGEKGIYFRLRVAGLSSSGEAKALCSALSSKGQPCLIPNDK